MKKHIRLNLKAFCFLLNLSLLLFTGGAAFAGLVPVSSAQKVAEALYMNQSGLQSVSGNLKYTSYDSNGLALYYTFDFGNKPGFVIVNAEDAGLPIIGYSIKESFATPDPKSSVGYWLSAREKEITYLRQNNIQANDAIKSNWSIYSSGIKQANRSASVNSPTVSPLTSTNWNQFPYYNALCPGQSVTGCVATAMAQIMKFWNYPGQGTRSSSYCDCTSQGYANNYGTLSANYGTTTYNWANMPNDVSSSNIDVATLMLQCGISVQMNYDPSGSSAAVINADNPISAEHSYMTYFGYDPNSIEGVYRNAFYESAWIAKLQADLNIGRPVQYAGFGPGGGHTWVCDGYDENNFFHMNWGWGGSDNGFFSVDALNPEGEDFSSGQEALFGIVPVATNPVDAGVVSVTQNTGCSNTLYSPVLTIRNFGISTLTSCNVNYKLDNSSIQTINWTGSLVTGQPVGVALTNYTLTTGSHTLTCFTANPNNQTDPNNLNDQLVYTFQIYAPDNLPVIEGFENPAFTANHWDVLPSAGSNWTLTSSAFSGGSKSMMIDNMNNTAGNSSIMQGLNDYDLSNVSEPYMSFKVAYQQKTTSSNDKLSLQISDDCGNTWWTKWSLQGSALATAPPMPNTPYVPPTTDFASYAIPTVISDNVIFRWVFDADAVAPGNNIYLDDVNLYDNSVGIKVYNSSPVNDFELFPNPANGETNLKFNLKTSANIKINVVDVFGREVMQIADTEYRAGEQTISLNKNASLNKGVYFVTLTSSGSQTTRKLVVN